MVHICLCMPDVLLEGMVSGPHMPMYVSECHTPPFYLFLPLQPGQGGGSRSHESNASHAHSRFLADLHLPQYRPRPIPQGQGQGFGQGFGQGLGFGQGMGQGMGGVAPALPEDVEVGGGWVDGAYPSTCPYPYVSACLPYRSSPPRPRG